MVAKKALLSFPCWAMETTPWERSPVKSESVLCLALQKTWSEEGNQCLKETLSIFKILYVLNLILFNVSYTEISMTQILFKSTNLPECFTSLWLHFGTIKLASLHSHDLEVSDNDCYLQMRFKIFGVKLITLSDGNTRKHANAVMQVREWNTIKTWNILENASFQEPR